MTGVVIKLNGLSQSEREDRTEPTLYFPMWGGKPGNPTGGEEEEGDVR